MNRNIFTFVLLALVLAAGLQSWKFQDTPPTGKVMENSARTASHRKIAGAVQKGETLYDIFKKHELDSDELFQMKEASAGIHRLREISIGNPYRIEVDEEDRITEFTYWIDDESCLTIARDEEGFSANKTVVEYDKKTIQLGGIIEGNLIASMGEGRESVMLALNLSDIFAWDIDFTTDLKKGDTFKILVEGLYRDGTFRKYGKILSAELMNNGEVRRAYLFEFDGKSGYFDGEGRSLRKAFLKAPLSFRRISSNFCRNRFHPVLKIYRPHHGVDYAAPHGTPVVSVGEGIVTFAGYRNQYGKLVIVEHPKQYATYYGHLSRIASGVRKGARVSQGQVVGAVGSTGMATGPHLHYELRIAGRPMNPLKIDLPGDERIPSGMMAAFNNKVGVANRRLAGIDPVLVAFAARELKK